MAHYLLIPVCEVAGHNSLAHTRTEKRLKRGLYEWNAGGCYDKIIVSGGHYFSRFVQTLSAASLMKWWLIERNVIEPCILCDHSSRDTYQNIRYSLFTIREEDENGDEPDITVVTHWQQALRVKFTFWRAYGLRVHIIPMFYWVDAKTFVYEWVMLLYHMFDRYGTGFIAKRNREARTFT